MTKLEAAELVLSRPNPWDDCITCDGYGWIRDKQEVPTARGPFVIVTCSSCHGSGCFMPGPLKRAYKLLKLKKPKFPGSKPTGHGSIGIEDPIDGILIITDYDS